MRTSTTTITTQTESRKPRVSSSRGSSSWVSAFGFQVCVGIYPLLSMALVGGLS